MVTMPAVGVRAVRSNIRMPAAMLINLTLILDMRSDVDADSIIPNTFIPMKITWDSMIWHGLRESSFNMHYSMVVCVTVRGATLLHGIKDRGSEVSLPLQQSFYLIGVTVLSTFV